MRQDQLDGLITFLCVAEQRSFSAAAVHLGVSPSAVSQAIRTLEQRLGVALFHRTTRSIGLTEIGARYLERVKPAVHELGQASEELRESNGPSGLLRLNVPRAGHMIVLQPLLRAFLDAYPQINLEIVIDGLLIDIVAGGFDAGIRFGDQVDGDMVAIKIGPPITAHIVAAPDYLDRRGRPLQPRDLLEHDCICFRHVTTGQIERWEFARNGESLDLAVKGRLIVNDSAALVQAALDGIGVAYMINGYIERFITEGRLVRLLTDWSPPLAGLTLYYPDRRRVSSKLRVFIDFLRQNMPGSAPKTDGNLS